MEDNKKQLFTSLNFEKQIFSLTPHELNELSIVVDRAKYQNSKTRYLQQMELNKHYIGKCYKQTYETAWFKHKKIYYYKVVSQFANNEHRLTVLKFPEIPTCKYQTRINKKTPFILSGSWDLFSIEIEYITINTLSSFEEIDLETFNTAFDKHMNILKELEFNL